MKTTLITVSHVQFSGLSMFIMCHTPLSTPPHCLHVHLKLCPQPPAWLFRAAGTGLNRAQHLPAMDSCSAQACGWPGSSGEGGEASGLGGRLPPTRPRHLRFIAGSLLSGCWLSTSRSAPTGVHATTVSGMFSDFLCFT